ncbi:hypothetical protein F0562_031553 [Nyssa sinensis]|uniref:Protein kinase domain-containing protein n=1 Tax=Nyssa sinensis TaxID=561372 RepID=A0A5J5AVY8_9ASTE|nr:hypothetical protein F0562_031553 [Nyssa sinensis]
MIELWRFGEHRLAMLMVITCLLYLNLNLCWSLNNEGLALLRFRDGVVSDPFGALSNWKDDVGVIDPCSWFGVECSDGNVMVLNLKDLCLGGTLAPDLGNLVHIKSIILRNNSFSGIVPKEIGDLEELEVLDLGHNNFSGPLPSNLGNNLSLAILLLDNNELFGSVSPEIHELSMLSEAQVDENWLSNAVQRPSCNKRSILWNIAQIRDVAQRRLMEVGIASTKPPSLSPTPSPSSEAPSSSPSPSPAPSTVPKSGSTNSSGDTNASSKGSSPNLVLILSGAIGGSVLLLILVIIIFLYRGNKEAVVKPWATGLSGQLQKAFVTGVPKLKRSELETACEDFSNVIDSSPIGTVYKGTLSSGVEIAVISITVISAKDWSNNLEAQFRNKIDTLSKVNHKNFVSLIGYCEEEEPFTRMMVFEYAPNGTLFEHLHKKAAEHLNWGMRMRIAMGMAYCLEHMHQLTPPIARKNLNSLAVNLTEDYAAKISDFDFWNEVATADVESHPESNIYSFGIILFEMITGRLPYSVDRWTSDYLRGDQPLVEMVDPTLKSFELEQLEKIGEVIKSCVHPDPKQRPAMREVTARLREITGIGPDGAIPKLSPLWWAELEVMSTEA